MCSNADLMWVLGLVLVVAGIGGGVTLRWQGIYLAGAVGAVLLVLGLLLRFIARC